MHVPVYYCFYFSICQSLWQLPILCDSLPPVYLKPAFNWSPWSLASVPHGSPFLILDYLRLRVYINYRTRSPVAYDVVKWPDQFKTGRELMLKMNFIVWFVKRYSILKNYRKTVFVLIKIKNSSLLFQNLRVKNYLPGDWVSEKDLAKGKYKRNLSQGVFIFDP